MSDNKTAKILANLTFHLVTSIQEKHTRLANKLGLTEAELRCLISLGNDKGVSNTKIADKMHLSPSRTTRIIDGLEAKRYLTKTHNRKDRRSLSLALSKKGSLVMHKIEEQYFDIHSEILREIKSSQRKPLINTMENLNAVAEKKFGRTKFSTTN
jgi:DNA-binding MarR family transcriptional regulator